MTPDDVNGKDDADIEIPAGELSLKFKGRDYVEKFVVPNVYFHVVTAYNILRHNGVPVGKFDFLGVTPEEIGLA